MRHDRLRLICTSCRLREGRFGRQEGAGHPGGAQAAVQAQGEGEPGWRASAGYRVPPDADLPERLGGILAAVSLISGEGCTGDPALCAEAPRLGRPLAALMLLKEPRRPCRTRTASSSPVPERDRTRRDRALITAGPGSRPPLSAPGPYRIQAAINAVHRDAPTAAATDWRQLVRLYGRRMAVAPEPRGRCHVLHAIRAGLLRRPGRTAEAATEYGRPPNRPEARPCGPAWSGAGGASDCERRHPESEECI